SRGLGSPVDPGNRRGRSILRAVRYRSHRYLWTSATHWPVRVIGSRLRKPSPTLPKVALSPIRALIGPRRPRNIDGVDIGRARSSGMAPGATRLSTGYPEAR